MTFEKEWEKFLKGVDEKAYNKPYIKAICLTFYNSVNNNKKAKSRSNKVLKVREE